MSYHLQPIPVGQYGDISKIEEELLELKDAQAQGIKIMELNELSDIIVAIEGYLEKNHLGTTLDDVIAMKNATRRAFESGHITSKK